MEHAVHFPDLRLPSDHLVIHPWPDDVIDTLGFDPRSSYVERYWLGILGPSTTWLLRRLAAGFEVAPEGFELSLAETARQLGLGDRGGRHSPFMRAIVRAVQFELAELRGDTILAVRRRLPPLNRRQVMRLSPALQIEHGRWQQEQRSIPSAEQQRQRCRRLALSLVEVGEDLESAERYLLRWRYHPGLAHDAVRWASEHRRSALADAGDQSSPPFPLARDFHAEDLTSGPEGKQLAPPEAESPCRTGRQGPSPTK
jgi:hypothetical protein